MTLGKPRYIADSLPLILLASPTRDASVDFPFWRSARFASGRPEPGEHIDNYITNGEIYGYPKIRYTLELEHASLVGDGEHHTGAHRQRKLGGRDGTDCPTALAARHSRRRPAA